jgi:hypothetical protein
MLAHAAKDWIGNKQLAALACNTAFTVANNKGPALIDAA